ncbi:hypothetical protein LXA43DRAFT_1155258, partial [Ganoderma leucocontextum]
MSAFVKTLLRWDPGVSPPAEGVLGTVKAYYGCVEAQGRGTLHCHMLVWVEGGLNPQTLKEKLISDDSHQFGSSLAAYLEDLINTEMPQTPAGIEPSSFEPTKRPLTHRGFPLNMTDGQQLDDFRQWDLYDLVAACQRHQHSDTCYKYADPKDLNPPCRFQLDPDVVQPHTLIDHASGTIDLRHGDGMINNYYNPTVLEAMRCNMDLKFVGSGDDAKALTYYLTNYVSKSPLKTHVGYSALEHAVKQCALFPHDDDNLAEQGKRLLRKCAFCLTANQELSAQQVAAYLEGHDDKLTSHTYANLFWRSFERHIEQQTSSDDGLVDSHPHLEQTTGADDHADEQTTGDEDVTVTTSPTGDLRIVSNQLYDYIHRGDQLDALTVWDFVAQTEKVSS